MDKPKTAPQRSRRRVIASLVLLVTVLATTSAIVHFRTAAYRQSPLDRFVQRFGQIDGQSLHWNYEAMLKAYQDCRDSTYQEQLLDLMVASKAVHLVPDIIDSISSGGFMDTERKIRTIIKLTGHDFSKEFDITSVAQQPYTDEVKARLRGWWMENSQRTTEVRGPEDTFHVPNDWSRLGLTLATEKSQYLELEPIRLTASLENRGDTWYTFRYRRPKPAFKLEFFRVVVDGTVKISEVRYPDRWIICGNASRWFAFPDCFVIDPGSSHVMQQWVNNGYEGCFEAGEVALRAVLTPLYGKHKGRRLVSNDLQIDVVKPQGEDAAAHQFLTGTQAVDVGNGLRAGPEFVRFGGLVRNPSSSYNSAVDDHFIHTYSPSRYAYYVRYTQASVARWYVDSRNSYPPNATYSNADTVLVTRLTEIVRDASRDFPLLADAYVMFLDYYKETGELEKMADVSATIQLDDLSIADPRLSGRLVALMEYPQVTAADVHRKDRLGRTSLHKAVENGPPALVLFLLAKGADVNAHGNEETPLYIAAKAGRNKLVEALLAHGAEINAKSSGVTALFWPIQDGRIDTVKLLLDKGAEVNVTDNSNRTPFEWAINHNRLETARLLAASQGEGGRTPLHWAVEHGRRAMVYNLLKNGARIDVSDDAGRTPWDIAESQADNDSHAMAILLLLKEYAQTK